MGYLTAISRKLDRPLAVMVQSSSAGGKSALMEAVLSLVPEEERVQYSAMTGQSLFYMGETDLKHKLLACTDRTSGPRDCDRMLYCTSVVSMRSLASCGACNLLFTPLPAQPVLTFALLEALTPEVPRPGRLRPGDVVVAVDPDRMNVTAARLAPGER